MKKSFLVALAMGFLGTAANADHMKHYEKMAKAMDSVKSHREQVVDAAIKSCGKKMKKGHAVYCITKMDDGSFMRHHSDKKLDGKALQTEEEMNVAELGFAAQTGETIEYDFAGQKSKAMVKMVDDTTFCAVRVPAH